MKIDKSLIAQLETIEDPQTLISEIFKKFGPRAAIGTSGQLTGVVMIDMAVQSGLKPRVFTIDTLRLFKETYELFDEIEKKYQITVEKLKPDPKKIEAMVKEHGEYLFFDSKKKQELCCGLRKVEPNERVLKTLDVWLTGLRLDQSQSRSKTNRFEIIPEGSNKRPILKVAPLINWTEKELREYIKKYDVPHHKLLDWNQNGWYYESLGCVICTTPIGPDEPRRAGRWRWFNQPRRGVEGDDPGLSAGGRAGVSPYDDDKECGIHRVKEDEV